MGSLMYLSALGVLAAVVIWKLINRKRMLKGHEISAKEARELWENHEVFIDVRTDEEYQRAHIPGIISLPVKELSKRVHEVPKDRNVYLMCSSGNRSAEATIWLMKKGFDTVYNVQGGMLKWTGPLEKKK